VKNDEPSLIDDPPWNAAEIAIRAKLAVQPDLFLVALDGDQVVGSIMAGYDGHRGWLYAVAVLNSHHRRGVGAALVHGAEDRLQSAGCDKINLQVRASNGAVVEFYKRVGYVIEERISIGKLISRVPRLQNCHTNPPHRRRDRRAMPRARDGAAERGVSEPFRGCFGDTATVTSTCSCSWRSILGVR
jgi:ribosomal protein S18 acetylase RimI-like enzyme